MTHGSSPHTSVNRSAKRDTHPGDASSLKVAVLVSGSGSNLQSLIDSWHLQPEQAQLNLVLSNRPEVRALARAQAANIATCVVDHKDYESNAEFNNAMHDVLRDAGIDLIVLAGFMRILTPTFLDHWAGRVINIHPSLLPAYRGLNTHARALSDQQQSHGCSVHWVVPALDAGPLIAQASLDIESSDTAESLQQRVQQLEHKLYPLALHWVLTQVELPHLAPVSLTNDGDASQPDQGEDKNQSAKDTNNLLKLSAHSLQKTYTTWTEATLESPIQPK